jgi:hypothetical protein
MLFKPGASKSCIGGTLFLLQLTEKPEKLYHSITNTRGRIRVDHEIHMILLPEPELVIIFEIHVFLHGILIDAIE